MGKWQTQEQSLASPPEASGEGAPCLFNSEHSNEAQSSSLLPVKQSASPQMNREAAKQTARSKPIARQPDVNNL
jgi:hypothetical protein